MVRGQKEAEKWIKKEKERPKHLQDEPKIRAKETYINRIMRAKTNCQEQIRRLRGN